MAEHKIVPGDVVQLKSGGPHMTVNSIDGNIYCTWFDDKNNLRTSGFAPETLDWIDPNRTFGP